MARQGRYAKQDLDWQAPKEALGAGVDLSEDTIRIGKLGDVVDNSQLI